MKIVSLYPNFANQGGAQDVLMKIAIHFNDSLNPPIVFTNTPEERIDRHYKDRADFRKFSILGVSKFTDSNTVFISHDRRYSTLLCLANRILRKKIRLVHVAHNLFFDKKTISIYPEHIIAVSNAVKNNLIDFYGIPGDRVKVIYNGIKDEWNGVCNTTSEEKIKIILPGRINKVKRQVEIVENLRGKLDDNIEITFAGTGPDDNKLIEVINCDPHFKYIGHVNLSEVLPQFDYVMLFSEKEGLPLSLIDGCMFAKPLVTNRIAPVLEVNHNGKNGLTFDSFEELAKGINKLYMPNSERYRELSLSSRKIYEERFMEDKMLLEYSEYIKSQFG